MVAYSDQVVRRIWILAKFVSGGWHFPQHLYLKFYSISRKVDAKVRERFSCTSRSFAITVKWVDKFQTWWKIHSQESNNLHILYLDFVPIYNRSLTKWMSTLNSRPRTYYFVAFISVIFTKPDGQHNCCYMRRWEAKRGINSHCLLLILTNFKQVCL